MIFYNARTNEIVEAERYRKYQGYMVISSGNLKLRYINIVIFKKHFEFIGWV